MQAGRTREAEQLFRQAVEDNPRYAQAFLNLGLALAGQERFAEAEQYLTGALALAPGDARAQAALRMVQERRGAAGRERP
jgi:tetratricopeptide (TPR) repeat protein